MKVMNTVGSMLGILTVLTLGAGANGNDSPDGPSQASTADRVSAATDPGDHHVVHAIWQRPGWVAEGQGCRNPKIWI